MKRIIITSSIIFGLFFSLNAQSIDEAFKFSQLFYGGSARFQAMGGAFASLGGDLSTLSQNPAGLGLFRSYELSITPQMYFNNTDSKFGDTNAANVYKMNLNQIGFVYPLLQNNEESGLVSINLGYAYNKTNNFNENITISGKLNNSSMIDYFASNSQDRYYKDLDGGEGLAFDVFVFDTLSGTNGRRYATVLTNFGKNSSSQYGQEVRRVIRSTGYSREHALSFASNFSEKFYLGLTLAFSSISSTLQYDHVEEDVDNLIYDFKKFTYSDVVEIEGSGFSAKLGAIVRPVENLRVGLAVHTPVVYRINEYYYDYASSVFDTPDLDDKTDYDSENEDYKFEYTLTTPLRIMAGASYQIGKAGIVSADYEFVDYKMARYSNASDDYNYYIENQSIKKEFDLAHNLRFGAEVRLATSYYLRAGYALYGSGFTKGHDNEKSSHSIYSGGFGFRHSSFYIDLTYSLKIDESKYYMYDHKNLDAAIITKNKNMVSLTMGMKF